MNITEQTFVTYRPIILSKVKRCAANRMLRCKAVDCRPEDRE